MDGPSGGLSQISIVSVCSATLHLHRYGVEGEKRERDEVLIGASIVESQRGGG